VNRVGSQNTESINNIFNIRDIEVDIDIMLVKRKRAVGLNHSLNIKTVHKAIKKYNRETIVNFKLLFCFKIFSVFLDGN
jgi:Mg2+/Co2+ transporter CorB